MRGGRLQWVLANNSPRVGFGPSALDNPSLPLEGQGTLDLGNYNFGVPALGWIGTFRLISPSHNPIP